MDGTLKFSITRQGGLKTPYSFTEIQYFFLKKSENTAKLGNKERFDKEQIAIGIKKPFPVTNLPFTS